MVVVWTTRQRRWWVEDCLKWKNTRMGSESALAPQPQQIGTVDRLLGWIRTRDRKQATETRRREVRPGKREIRTDHQ
jgi:hypothetical protein